MVSAPVYDTAQMHSGTYALRMASAVAGAARYDLAATKTTGTLWGRGYWRFDALPTSAVQIILMESDTGTDGLEVRWLEPNDVFQLRNVISGTVVNSTITPTLNAWYRFEWKVVIADTGGSMELKIFLGDDTTALETVQITGEDTLPGIYRRGGGSTQPGRRVQRGTSLN